MHGSREIWHRPPSPSVQGARPAYMCSPGCRKRMETGCQGPPPHPGPLASTAGSTLEEEEVKKPGSRGQGNVCPSGGRKGRVHGAAGDEGRRLLPWQWCGAFRKDMAFLLRLLSRQARRRPEKLRLGQGCLLGPPEHLSPGISRLCLTGTFCPGPSIPLGLDTKTCVWRPEPGPSPA